MKKRIIVVALLLVAAVTWFGLIRPGGESSGKTILHVLAAASLNDVMKEIEQRYEKNHDSIDLVISYASSGKLQQQIEQGVPADLFISAGVEQMDRLEGKQLISDRVNLLENRLVLITRERQSMMTDVHDLISTQVQTVSIGYPDTVPAGHYAKQILLSYELWEPLQSKIVYASDVTQVLAHVQTGNADAGLVYRTDAAAAKQVSVVETVSSEHHDPVIYPVGIVKRTANPEASKELYRWLQREEAGNIFKSYGFEMSE